MLRTMLLGLVFASLSGCSKSDGNGSNASYPAEAEKIESQTLNGMSPVLVEVVTSSPEKSLDDFVNMGAKTNPRLPMSAVLNERVYVFVSLDIYNHRLKGCHLKDGDKIFNYLFWNQESLKAYVKQRGFAKCGEFQRDTLSMPLYKSSDGGYAVLLIKEGNFCCPLHKEISQQMPGKCSICGLELLPCGSGR